jgi:hypothetical protein
MEAEKQERAIQRQLRQVANKEEKEAERTRKALEREKKRAQKEQDVTVPFRVRKVGRVTWSHVTILVHIGDSGCQYGQLLTLLTRTLKSVGSGTDTTDTTNLLGI